MKYVVLIVAAVMLGVPAFAGGMSAPIVEASPRPKAKPVGRCPFPFERDCHGEGTSFSHPTNPQDEEHPEPDRLTDPSGWRDWYDHHGPGSRSGNGGGKNEARHDTGGDTPEHENGELK